ncbi:BEND2 protein, partial [Rhinopomastus cyanomelas]|nr:BEND2 protein [Rhinopomastus cyanomelas]
IRTKDGDYEDNESVIYEYEPDYECGSVVSETSYAEACYTGDQQKTLMEVLSYCQALYDAIQKLDKKFDVLHRKVSEMQHARIRPMLIKPVSQERHSPLLRPALPNGHVLVNPTIKSVQQSPQLESQHNLHRQSPPLPTIVSTHSLNSSYTGTSRMPELSPQTNLTESVVESTDNAANSPTSPVASTSMPTLSDTSLTIFFKSFCLTKEFVGDPLRNVEVLGSHTAKARQKTKPKYAARYLVRVLFPKETLLCGAMGAGARGCRILDLNKIAAIREFLATNFPNYDLSEHGKDWQTCVISVNSMIRRLRSEAKLRNKVIVSNYIINIWKAIYAKWGLKRNTDWKTDTSHGVDSKQNEDKEGSSQNSLQMTSSTADKGQNSGLDKLPENFYTSSVEKTVSLEPMEFLGSPWRNVQLPFSVIYVAKGKSRPELSARYLIRHMFPEDVLVSSNVYGSPERGLSALDSNSINALRDFLQEAFPSFDLKETGYDWKACVAAINSTIRSLRHDHRKAAAGV